MRSKLLILLAAIVLGAAAALAAVVYVGSARQGVEQGSQPIEVLVAKQDIPRGTPVTDVLQMVDREMIPRRFVAAGAISTTRTLDGQVLATSLGRGEQLTQGRFQFPSSAGLSYTIPKDFLAVSVPYAEVSGAGGLVKPGDYVAVLVTLPDASGQMTTRIMLPKARVLALGQSVGVDAAAPRQNNSILAAASAAPAPSAQQQKAGSVTLALAASDVEKLVFAEENGKIWLALLPAEQTQVPSTPGRTQRTLFDR